MINVVGALIIKNDKFLLAQRAGGELKGKWEFPGGKVKEDESGFEAIKREIKEELNLAVTPLTEILTFRHKYPFGGIRLILIKCSLDDQVPQIISDGSHTKTIWVTLQEKGLDLAPLDQKVFNYLIKNNAI